MIIGLTGSIASGKSTVADMLRKRKLPIVDADVVSRLVVEPGSKTLKDIVEVFGQEVLREDGGLDRKKLGELIFNDTESRQKLNAIIHPAIRKEMLRQRDEWLQKGSETVIMDIPLLFESELQHFVDKILVVSVTEEIQLRRLMARNALTETEARVRMASQLPIEIKEKGADAILYNNGEIEETEEQLNRILRDWGVE